mmetsp:Transcript_190/g.196  ORF Transcript_190/g.196 Transcript_190/m.196 type:complete len:103 (-) Transcript_190:397-705(-)|eukprot:CAMPEP_0197823422 /NCGR_PEP_ID=MMETSP1437-20131217/759_1 /TAXON_ID=49252 ORGANISM="Eucampia antarctica, Strain CCMP1452" /NCGR_SAMPLE_ID=MMETSP1437 /ASSEMBLY_ACC=CAM_ASM_001096 /LENGTH=102 /DNA_ID=CAMNT_0043422583 /DNA_START=93 /DNA_END=404 /DNA_ORIENTATION=+
MDFFTGGKQEPPKPDAFFAAKTEMEMYTVLFNNLTMSCFNKCASRKHKEPDLQLGEMSCIDRCVSKYMEAQEKIGVVLQKANESQAQQMQQMQQMQGGEAGR